MAKDALKAAFENYNPDEDYNLAQGRKLADAAMERFKGDTKAIAQWFQQGKIPLNRKIEQAIEESAEKSTAEPTSADRYSDFLQDASGVESYQTKMMGNLLVRNFPELYAPGRERQLKGMPLSEVKREFQRRKSAARAYLKRHESD